MRVLSVVSAWAKTTQWASRDVVPTQHNDMRVVFESLARHADTTRHGITLVLKCVVSSRDRAMSGWATHLAIYTCNGGQ